MPGIGMRRWPRRDGACALAAIIRTASPTGLDMEWMGYLAAVLTTVAFVPQALKTIRSRDTGGISLAMYVVFTIGIACWFGYGVWLGSWPMILSNIVTFALAATILALKLKHG